MNIAVRRCTLLLLCARLASPMASGVAADDPPAWSRDYEQGVVLVRQGQGAQARARLEAALRLRPEEGLRVPVDGVRYVDYLPHLYLAVANHMVGDVERARAELETAARLGTAARSKEGATLLAAYSGLLLGPVAAEEKGGTGTAAEPGFARYPPREPVLSEEQAAAIQRDVFARCGLPPNGKALNAPWYVHYELGRALSERADYQRAVAAFIEATRRRPKSGRYVRTYGVWLVDYLPYVQIARSHAHLGNWSCVSDALAVSKRMGEITDLDREMAELRRLGLQDGR
jgi:tetratricopeptide (TPR) repeat protein